MIGTRASGIVAPEFASVPIDMAPIAALPNLSGPRRDPSTGRANWTETGMTGFGQRLSDKLREPGMSEALLRGAAAAWRGEGLGGSLDAIAGAREQQQKLEQSSEQRAFENQMAMFRHAIAQQQANAGDRQVDGSLTNDAFRIDETGRSNRAREALEANGQRVQVYGIDTGAATSRANNAADNATSRANNSATVGASIYGTDAETYRAGRLAGIGTKGYAETQVKTPGTPAVNRWFGPDTPAVPESVTTTRTDLAPGGGEIRYDAAGNAYRRDPATGQPVRVR